MVEERTVPSNVSRSGRAALGDAYTRWQWRELFTCSVVIERCTFAESYLTGHLQIEQDQDMAREEDKNRRTWIGVGEERRKGEHDLEKRQRG